MGTLPRSGEGSSSKGEALLALIIGKCLAVVDGGACLGGAAASSYNGTANMSQQFVTFTV